MFVHVWMPPRPPERRLARSAAVLLQASKRRTDVIYRFVHWYVYENASRYSIFAITRPLLHLARSFFEKSGRLLIGHLFPEKKSFLFQGKGSRGSKMWCQNRFLGLLGVCLWSEQADMGYSRVRDDETRRLNQMRSLQPAYRIWLLKKNRSRDVIIGDFAWGSFRLDH